MALLPLRNKQNERAEADQQSPDERDLNRFERLQQTHQSGQGRPGRLLRFVGVMWTRDALRIEIFKTNRIVAGGNAREQRDDGEEKRQGSNGASTAAAGEISASLGSEMIHECANAKQRPHCIQRGVKLQHSVTLYWHFIWAVRCVRHSSE